MAKPRSQGVRLVGDGSLLPAGGCSLAKAQGLDLVMVSPRAQPPVARLVEWSKVGRGAACGLRG